VRGVGKKGGILDQIGQGSIPSPVWDGDAGIEVPVALAATLLFRGLSFWLPMLPGVLLARRLLR